jgi:hypothetical protein
MAATTSTRPAPTRANAPAGGAQGRTAKATKAAAASKGTLRDKATAGVSAVQPELAPVLAAENRAHEKVFGSRHTLSSSSARPLMIEFLICFVVLGLGTIVAPEGSGDGVPRLMSRGTGLCLLFFVLGLVSGAGDGARRAAGGLGALVTVSYLVMSSDAHNVLKWIAGFYSTKGVTPTNPFANESALQGLEQITGMVAQGQSATGSGSSPFANESALQGLQQLTGMVAQGQPTVGSAAGE